MKEKTRNEIKKLAKSIYAENASKDDFLAECGKYQSEFQAEEGEMTDENAQIAHQTLSEIWSESLIEAENDKLGQVVSDLLTMLGNERSVTHFKSREQLIEYLNPITAKALEMLTESNLKSDDVLKVLDSMLGKVKMIGEEIQKSINVHKGIVFEKKVGKAGGDLTLKEIAEILKD